MLLGLLLSAAAVIAVVGVYPGVAGHNLGIGISTFVGFSACHAASTPLEKGSAAPGRSPYNIYIYTQSDHSDGQNDGQCIKA